VAIVGSDLSGIIGCSMIAALSTIQSNYMRLFANKNFLSLDGLELLGGSLKEKDEFIIPILKLLNEFIEVEFDNPIEYLPKFDCIKTLDKEFFYDQLVITSEPSPNYESIPGLNAALLDNYSSVGSLGDLEMAEKSERILENYRVSKESKKIVFYIDGELRQNYYSLLNLALLFEEKLRTHNKSLKEKTEIIYATNSKSICHSVQIFDDYLTKLLSKKEIKIMTNVNLMEVDQNNSRMILKEASGTKNVLHYGILIAEPPYELPLHLKKSPFLDSNGKLNFDSKRMVHNEFPNVFYMGSLLHPYQSINSFYEQGNIVSRNIMLNIRNQDQKQKFKLLEYNNYCNIPIYRADRKITRLNLDDEKFEIKEEGLKTYLWETYGQTEIIKRFMQKSRWFGKHNLLKPDYKVQKEQ
jgi:hypothetical protein